MLFPLSQSTILTVNGVWCILKQKVESGNQNMSLVQMKQHWYLTSSYLAAFVIFVRCYYKWFHFLVLQNVHYPSNCYIYVDSKYFQTTIMFISAAVILFNQLLMIVQYNKTDVTAAFQWNNRDRCFHLL